MERPIENSLTIVIPALNEAEAIARTISRCLDARQQIMDAAGLTAVEVIVVSDGSTDRTAEIARSFNEVKVIVFEQNRGYGAAIKEGWRQGRGALLGFMDADGTCDPNSFADLCRIAIRDSADVVLGSRLGPDSKMPWLRRIGNRFFALLLGFLCGRHVTDAASGMRVVRREALKYLYPLPDGLHFTPSMSARALMNNLRTIEVPMPYQERIGRSKLGILRDGVWFLQTIFAGVLCYRPERILLLCFAVCVFIMLLIAANPVEFYIQNGRLEEWMIYRFVVCYFLGSFGLLLLLAIALVNQMAHFSRRRSEANLFWPSIVGKLLQLPVLGLIMALLLMAAIMFLWPGIVEFVATRHVSLHWSRLLAGTFSLLSLVQTAVFVLLIKVVSIWKFDQTDEGSFSAEDRPHSRP
jgi:glycosyltransferase involved in cell wall biosynthesis